MLLAIDIGTSACRIALFEYDGNVLASVSQPCQTSYPNPEWERQDPDTWWDSVCGGIRQLLQITGFDPAGIDGIGVAGQSRPAIPVDRDGNCLARTPVWPAFGNKPHPSYCTPKFMWFKKEYPEIYKNTYKFLQCSSYIVMKLTGETSQDYSQGYGLHFFDNARLAYDENLAEDFGIDLEKLPRLYGCHSIVGGVSRRAAKKCGLKEGTPVAAGGPNAACRVLGAGIYRNGQTLEQGGHADGVSICMDKAAAHPQMNLSAHVVPGRWLLQGGSDGGGRILNWIRQELWNENFDSLTKLAGEVPAGSEGVRFLPYMAGGRSSIWGPDAKGVIFGLTYDKTKAHMIRAALEGTAFYLEHHLRTAAEAGVRVNILTAMGGAAKSHLWTQIKSDVTGKVIGVSETETAAALGAAILAGVGTGVYRDFEDAVNRTCRITRVHTPDSRMHEVYREAMDEYLALYERLKNMF